MSEIELKKRVADGLVSAIQDGDLTIYNYTNRCVYAQAWDEYTLAARYCGRIATTKGRNLMQTTKKLHRTELNTIVVDKLIRVQLLHPDRARLRVTAPDASEILLERTGYPGERPLSDGAWESPVMLDMPPSDDVT